MSQISTASRSSFTFSILKSLAVVLLLGGTAVAQDPIPQPVQVQGAPVQETRQGPVYGGPTNVDAEFRAAVLNLVNNYRFRGVSNSLLNNVENAARGGGGGQLVAPQVRITNIDSYGSVSVFYSQWGAPAFTLGPGQTSNPISISGGPVYLQASKTDQFGNSKVLNIQIEQLNGTSARFWDGDDFRYFTLQPGQYFPRGLNNMARLQRYRLER